MRLWTIQPKVLFDKLQAEKVIRCDSEKSPLVTECGFGPSYDWMAEQMIRRVGPPPEGVKYPIWAWHTLGWKHAKPDLRRSEFRGYNEPQVCMELEIPDHDVLLSNEDMWHIVLNDGYYGNAANEQEYDAEEAWFDSLSPVEQEHVRRKSWEKIFDVSPARENDWDSHGKYVQATFWELRLGYVKAVRHFSSRQVNPKGF